jgi:hypothetical protein
MSAENYRSYHGLPPLAGICSFDDAMRPGLSVEECVRRLKRDHYACKRLHEIFLARLAAEPIYELKMAFSLHAHLCGEHVTALRQRVGEMREPPLGLDIVPDPNLALFFDEILAAPATGELLIGVYAKAIPALLDALEKHRSETNLLADAPSIRLCKFAIMEFTELRDYGAKAIAALCKNREEEGESGWEKFLDRCLAAAGGLDGTHAKSGESIPPRYSAEPFVYDKIPVRDERFPDPYNMAVNAESFLYNPDFPPEPKVLMIYYKRLREIDVPEMMASIITETKGKPWSYYRDMTRQLWDEARHAMMGEVGFVNLGVDWTNVMINFTWSLGLNTQLTPKERHGVPLFH